VPDDARITNRDDIAFVGKGRRQLCTGPVSTYLRGQFPDRFKRLSRRGDVRAQPPQRPSERMTLDDSTAGHHETGRIEVQRTERMSGLFYEGRWVDAVSSGHVAKMFDRMHDSNVPAARAAGLVAPAGCIASPPSHTAIIRRVADTDLKLPADLVLTPLVNGAAGTARPIMEWLTTFHLASVVLDPYTNESSWILRTATRVLTEFRDTDARINLIVTASPADAATFLGPLAEKFLVFCDPDRLVVKAMGLAELPAFVLTRVDGVVDAKAEGWNPAEWEAVCDAIAKITKWSSIELPASGDPVPFRGSPAQG
jgi:hypothetical protein